MLEAVDEGLVKGWGVSNYGIGHLEEIKEKFPGKLPLVNQIELNPFITQSEIVKYCRDNGIVLEAYTPLAKGSRFGDERLKAVVGKYSGRSAAEVMIKWGLQEGFVSLPKSVTQSRIAGNLRGAEGWALEEEDMEVLRSLDEHFVTGTYIKLQRLALSRTEMMICDMNELTKDL